MKQILVRKLKQSLTISNKTKLNTIYHQKISTVSSENVSKYEFLTGKDILLEKNLLEESAALKWFQYTLLGKELKKQTSVAEKQYQEFESNKKEAKVKRRRAKSNLVYDDYFTFYKYHFPKIHRSVLPKTTIDLLYFWDVYNVNLREKRFDRRTAYSCRTNIFI